MNCGGGAACPNPERMGAAAPDARPVGLMIRRLTRHALTIEDGIVIGDNEA
jgi:hypothetical protein